ncbi:MazG-like family protein [Psychrobacter glaciei]|uniref:MazG-like family protein n=1 Tax=Psychrobacter glaciei TaxID=619771 RepID=UPI003F447AE9
MSNVQPLKWKKGAALDTFETVHELVHYTIRPDIDDPNKYRANLGNGDHKTLNSVEEAKQWIETDYYPHKMQPYVKPDMIGAYFDKFTQWGLDRGIIQNGNELAQGLKLVSEMGELTDNLAKGRCIKDDIGDCMVVLNMLANMTGVKLEDCLAQAWGDIKDRKGYMNEHGVFIKDGDNEVTK